jgi:hypothetical protein
MTGLILAAVTVTPSTLKQTVTLTRQAGVRKGKWVLPNVIHNTMVQIACPQNVLASDDFTAESEMKVYPNPVNDVLNIVFDRNISTVAIYNVLRQKYCLRTSTPMKAPSM